MAALRANSGVLAVDAMGGDLGPAEVVAGVSLFLADAEALPPIRLVGREEILGPLLSRARFPAGADVTPISATEVVEMTDKPLQARRKRDSSMMRAIELVRDGGAQCAVSCGNTGALVACGTLLLRPLPGLDRPALAPIMPTGRGHFIFLDAGANPVPKPEHLVHNAILGSDYCRAVLGVARPRVGLLTIGTEEGKGNELTQAAHEQLKRLGDLIHYIGPIEGFHVFADEVDVVVCDGFTGNIVLKMAESLFRRLKEELKAELTRTWLRQIRGLLLRNAFRDFREKFSPDRYGGAPLLGLQGWVLKSHGSSNRHAIAGALRIAQRIVSQKLDDRLIQDIAQANARLQPAPPAAV